MKAGGTIPQAPNCLGTGRKKRLLPHSNKFEFREKLAPSAAGPFPCSGRAWNFCLVERIARGWGRRPSSAPAPLTGSPSGPDEHPRAGRACERLTAERGRTPWIIRQARASTVRTSSRRSPAGSFFRRDLLPDRLYRPPERQLRQAADGGRSGLERIRVWSWRVALSDARTPLSAR
jgi:hypothetical protein